MFSVKFVVTFILYQVISLSEGAVIPQNTTVSPTQACSPVYHSCNTTDDCCKPGPLFCFPDSKCRFGTNPRGRTTMPPMTIPSNPGCGMTYDACTKTKDCCMDYVCSGDECVKEDDFMYPWEG